MADSLPPPVYSEPFSGALGQVGQQVVFGVNLLSQMILARRAGGPGRRGGPATPPRRRTAEDVLPRDTVAEQMIRSRRGETNARPSSRPSARVPGRIPESGPHETAGPRRGAPDASSDAGRRPFVLLVVEAERPEEARRHAR